MPNDLLPPTIDEQIALIEHEVAMRERVYRRVLNGGRTRASYERQITVMSAVLDTLRYVQGNV